MKNIVLIGMPACGKSVTGVVLAKSLKMKFIDTDLLIQEHAGKSLQEIIDHDGMEEFKRTEQAVLNSIEVEHAVIATGGSAVYYDDAMKHLKENGTVIYIKAGLQDVKRRLRNIKTRGVAMGKGQSLAELYAERVPLYEKYADITVASSRHSMEKTVEDMINKVKAVL